MKTLSMYHIVLQIEFDDGSTTKDYATYLVATPTFESAQQQARDFCTEGSLRKTVLSIQSIEYRGEILLPSIKTTHDDQD